MMLTQTPHHGASADLPKVWHPISMPGANRQDAPIVSILRDGTMYFGKHKTRPGDWPAQIREGVARGAEKKIYIRADKRLRYRTSSFTRKAVRNDVMLGCSSLARTLISRMNRSAASDSP